MMLASYIIAVVHMESNLPYFESFDKTQFIPRFFHFLDNAMLFIQHGLVVLFLFVITGLSLPSEFFFTDMVTVTLTNLSVDQNLPNGLQWETFPNATSFNSTYLPSFPKSNTSHPNVLEDSGGPSATIDPMKGHKGHSWCFWWCCPPRWCGHDDHHDDKKRDLRFEDRSSGTEDGLST